jgi:MFS transporter, SET family, sugar efflux transporter
MTQFAALWRDPAIRLVVLCLALLGVLNSSIYPYQSLIGLTVAGLTESQFAAVLVMASCVAVSASVLLGMVADGRAARRRIAIGTALVATAGVALMLLAPGPVVMVLAHGLLFPIASSLYGQFFALARLARTEEGAARETTLGAIRSAMSLSFLGMLVMWTIGFGAGVGVMWVYASALIAAVGLVALIWRRWPHDGQTKWEDRPSGLNFREALAEMAKTRILSRVLLIGGIASAGNLYMVLVSLVFTNTPERGTADVALYVGLVAGWEVPCMLILPRLAQRISRQTLMLAGTVFYVMHLALLPMLAASTWVWALTLLAGIGGTAIITLPIGYYQDLLPDRPGTAGALLAVQKLVSDVFAALAFALGMGFGGVESTALAGATMALLGASGLWWVDRRRAA